MTNSPPPASTFMDAGAVLPALAGNGWRASLRKFVEDTLGMTRTREGFDKASQQASPSEALLTEFGLVPDAAGVVEAIPKTGPVMVIANHPLGGADALMMIALCVRRRPDFRILANDVAASAPGIKQWVLPLSILGGRDPARKNAQSLRAALDHLRGGGLVAVFPAGEVSTWRPELGRIADITWSSHVASLALKTQARVLPVKFFGKNPPLFHIAGAIHSFLRTTLILRMMIASAGRPVICRAGNLIEPDDLAQQSEPITYLRKSLEAIDY